MYVRALLCIGLTNVLVSGNIINCAGKEECKQDSLQCLSDEVCSIICNGDNACQEAEIDAQNATNVNITCVGKKACWKLEILCPVDYDCSVFCIPDGESETCLEMTVNGKYSDTVTVNCESGTDKTCKEVDIECGYNECIVLCNAYATDSDNNCQNIDVDATLSSSLLFECDDSCVVSTAITSAPTNSPTSSSPTSQTPTSLSPTSLSPTSLSPTSRPTSVPSTAHQPTTLYPTITAYQSTIPQTTQTTETTETTSTFTSPLGQTQQSQTIGMENSVQTPKSTSTKLIETMKNNVNDRSQEGVATLNATTLSVSIVLLICVLSLIVFVVLCLRRRKKHQQLAFERKPNKLMKVYSTSENSKQSIQPVNDATNLSTDFANNLSSVALGNELEIDDIVEDMEHNTVTKGAFRKGSYVNVDEGSNDSDENGEGQSSDSDLDGEMTEGDDIDTIDMEVIDDDDDDNFAITKGY